MIFKFTSLNRTALPSTDQTSPRRSWYSSMLMVAVFLFLGGQVGYSQAPPVFDVCPVTATVTLPAGGGTVTFTDANIPTLLGVAASDPDGVSAITYSATPASVSCADIAGGAFPINVTATDVDGNATCNVITTVADGGPLAVCMDFTASLDGTGNVTVSASDIDGGSTSCTPPGITLSTIDGAVTQTYDCTNIGTFAVVLGVSNGAQTDQCTAMLTIQDTLDPVITCPAAPASVNNTPDSCNAMVTIAMAMATDNCSTPPTITNNFNAGGADASGIYPVGNTTVIFTATDASMNTSTCEIVVTVVDNENPTINCPSPVTTVNDAGACGANVASLTATAMDNCPGVTISNSYNANGANAAGFYPVGATTVTFTATDAAGLTATCSVIVTITDTEVPTVTCPTVAPAVNDAGLCTSSVSVMATITDNCGVASITNDFNAGGADASGNYPVGSTTVNFLATDVNGNTNDCAVIVVVTDNEAPTITAPSDQVVNNLAGNCIANVTWPTPATMDNCPGAVSVSYSATDEKGTAIPITSNGTTDSGIFPVSLAPTVVTYTVTDAAMNSSTGTFTVHVLDNEAPTVTCISNQIVTIKSCAAATELVPDFRGLIDVADNCPGSYSVTQVPTPGTIDPMSTLASVMGVTPANGETFAVTITVTDNNPNNLSNSTCTFTVTIDEDDAPVPTTPGAVLPTITEVCGPITIFAPTATDACGNNICGEPFPANIITSLGGTCSGGIATTGTLASGDTPLAIPDLGSTNSVINVSGVDPTHTVQDIIVTLDVSHSWVSDIDIELTAPDGVTSITLTEDLGGTGDNYSGTVFQDGNPSITTGAPPFLGTFEAIDGSMLTAFSGVPSLNGNWTLNAADDEAIITGTLNSWSIEIVTSPPPGTVTSYELPVGMYNITWVYDDGSGNTSSQLQSVDITNDVVPPTFSCNNVTLELDSNGDAEILTMDPTTSLSLTDDIGAASDLSGSVPIGFTFDFFGNTYSNLQISNNGFVTFDLAATNGDFSNDAVGTATGTNDLIAVAWDDLSPPANSIEYFTSGASPNQVFVVNFTSIPHFLSSATVTTQLVLHEGSNLIEIHSTDVQSDGGGMTQGIENMDGTIGFATPGRDNTPWSATNDYVAYTPDGMGGYTVNQSGTFAPVATPVIFEDLYNGLSDFCDPNPTVTTAQSLTYDCTDIGTNLLTLTATDASGNTSTCQLTVTVEDNSAPVINMATVPANVSGVDCTSIPTNTAVVTATDNCDSPAVSFAETNDATGNPLNCGNYTYTITRVWTASDNAGNISTASQTIDVIDDDEPGSFIYNASGPSGTFGNGANINTDAGQCFATVSLSMTGVTDCAPFSAMTFTYQIDGGAIQMGNSVPTQTYATGSHSVVFTATDPCGNIGTETFAFNVTDGIAPTASCVNSLNLGLPASGILILTPSAVDNNSFDNCTPSNMLSFSISPDTFTCADVGQTISVELFVNDGVLQSSCTTTVTIQDNNDPTAVVQNINVTLDGNGMASITAADIDNGSFDDCDASPAIAVTPTDFTTADIGPNVVTFTVTDASGNTATETATVNVLLEETCFDVGAEIGGAGQVIEIPVEVTGFTNVSGFQYSFDIDPDDANIDIGEFVGITNIHPSLSSNFIWTFTQDVQPTNNALDTFYSDVEAPFTDTIDFIVFDTLYFNNTINISWQGLPEVTLPDGESIFDLEVLLTGNIDDVGIISQIQGVIPEVSYNYSGTFFQGNPCFINGGFQINKFLIAGEIYTENGDPVSLTDVTLDTLGQNMFPLDMLTTTSDGLYEFEVFQSGDFEVTPSKDINWKNGVNIDDVVKIQQHAVGASLVNSVYKKIAADANNDGLITTFDAVITNNFVLNFISGAAPPPNASWRFVDANQMLTNDPDVIVPTFDESISFVGLITDTLNNDFIGVKIGDLTDDANPLTFNGDADNKSDDALEFVTTDARTAANETVSIDFTAKNFNNLVGYQWALAFDADAISFEGMTSNLSNNSVGTSSLEDGLVFFTWYNATGVTAKDNEVLFTLHFNAKKEGLSMKDLIELRSFDGFNLAAFDSNFVGRSIDLGFVKDQNDLEAAYEFELLQNQPNPFKAETNIGFTLPYATSATINISDATGRLLKVIEGDFAKGYNQVTLTKNELSASGVLYYQLETTEHTATMKMIIVE